MKKQPFWMIVFVLLIGSVLSLYARTSVAENLGQIWGLRLVIIALALSVWSSAWILGECVTSALFLDQPRISQTLLSLAIGPFLFSMLVLIMGTCGFLNETSSVILVLLLNGLGWRRWLASFNSLAATFQRFNTLRSLEVALMACIVFVLVFYFICSFTPPLDYDVVSYHLGAPWTYAKLGSPAPLAYNVYSFFPELIEMQAYFLFSLFPDAVISGMAAKQIIYGYLLCLVFSVYQLARLYMSRESALISCLIVTVFPWTGVLSGKFYVEVPLTFALLSSIWVVLDNRFDNYSALKRGLLIGVLWGIAAGIKYNGIFFGGPILVLLMLLSMKRESLLRQVSWIGLGMLIAFGPWLIRNYVYAGNPVYPLLNNVIGNSLPSAADVARWDQAHAPGEYGFISFIKSIKVLLIENNYFSVLAIFFMPGFIWACLKKHAVGKFCFSFLLCLALWYGFTHRIERFMYPAMVLLLLGCGVGWQVYSKIFPRRWLVLSLLGLFVVNALHQGLVFRNQAAHSLGFKPPLDFVKDQIPDWKTYSFINEYYQSRKDAVPSVYDSGLLMVGDPKDLYLSKDIPTTFHSVFDVRLIRDWMDNPDGMHDWLKARGIKMIMVNWAEMQRFGKTYTYAHQGRSQAGFLSPVHEQKMATFLRTYTNKIYPQKSDSLLGRNRSEVFLLK